MLIRGSLQRSMFSGAWEHFPHSARSTGRSVFIISIVTSIVVVIHIIIFINIINNNPAQPL